MKKEQFGLLRDESRRDPRPVLVPHEIMSAGVVMQDPNVKVTCVLADHPPLPVALSYRNADNCRPVILSDGCTGVIRGVAQ